MREQYYVATPIIIQYSQDVPPPSENPESAPGLCDKGIIEHQVPYYSSFITGAQDGTT